MRTFQFFIIASLLITLNSKAAVYCVTNSAQLQSALTSAQNSNEYDLIRVAEGHYVTPDSEFKYTSTSGWDLGISGGWTEFFGNPCGQQLSGSP
jgi:hypothetical protein